MSDDDLSVLKAEELLARALEAMPAKVTLVYPDYRDQLTDEQVASIVRGEDDWPGDYGDEWLSERQWDGVLALLEECLPEEDERDELQGSEEFETFRSMAHDRDDSDVWMKLAKQTPRVLLRIPIEALDEDHAYSFETGVEAWHVLNRLDFETTEANLVEVRQALAEHEPEFHVTMGYWIVGADVEDLLSLPIEGKVEIVNPYLYLGNPFAGSGWITEKALTGVAIVDRADLRTDKDAFGYSVDEVFGGLSPSQFEATIRPISDPT